MYFFKFHFISLNLIKCIIGILKSGYVTSEAINCSIRLRVWG